VSHFINLIKSNIIIKVPIAKGESLTELPLLLAAEH
jgi:hypothetical protein